MCVTGRLVGSSSRKRIPKVKASSSFSSPTSEIICRCMARYSNFPSLVDINGGGATSMEGPRDATRDEGENSGLPRGGEILILQGFFTTTLCDNVTIQFNMDTIPIVE